MSSKPSMTTTAQKPFPLHHPFAASSARAQLLGRNSQWPLAPNNNFIPFTNPRAMSGTTYQLNGIHNDDLRNMTSHSQNSPPVYNLGDMSANFFAPPGQETVWMSHNTSLPNFSPTLNCSNLDSDHANFVLSSFDNESWSDPYRPSNSSNPGTPNQYPMGFPTMNQAIQGPSSVLTYHSRTPSQLSPASSDCILTLSAPPTPTPQSSLPLNTGENISTAQENAASQNSSPRAMYTHREQYNLFVKATTLPTHNAGQFIPQGVYKPHTNSDRKRYVEEVNLEAPLYFEMDHPSEYGIALQDALHSRVKRLADREKPVFEGRGPSVSIRLEWPGYRQWTRQIPTKDFRSPPGPITMAKLAKNVAKCVQRFIEENKDRSQEEGTDQQWKVGTHPHEIKLEDIILVSLHHVSLGSWQPQLRLRRPFTLS